MLPTTVQTTPQTRPFLTRPPFQPEQFLQSFEQVSAKAEHPALRFWDVLAVTGNVILFLSAFPRLGMPLINKKARPLAEMLGKNISRFHPVTPEQVQKWSAYFADPNAVKKSLQQSYFIGAFLQGINNYQTAVNTRQPTLVLTALLMDLYNLFAVFYPKDFISALGLLFAGLYSVGKRTDIDNSNHPGQRRDFDFKRITRFLKKDEKLDATQSRQSFGHELKVFFGFVGHDLRNSFSIKPWQTLKQNFQNKETWRVPQADHSAISAQLFVMSWFMAQTAFLFKKVPIAVTGSVIQALSNLMVRVPLMSRAWQNKTEIDGQLFLLGAPLIVLGNLFQPQFTKKYFFLSGMALIGVPLATRGLTLNSRKYRALVQVLEQLYQQALLRPDLSGREVLNAFQSDPRALQHLQKRIGQSRVNFIIKTLEQADQVQRTQKIPLATFLAPMVSSTSV